MEIWKQYRDTIYEVSNLGNVRNRETKIIKKQHKKYNKDNDYMRVSLHIGKENKIISVHRLVAECFLENFNKDLEVNHKNSIRYDNKVENLEMTTKEQNYQHSILYGNGSRRKPIKAIGREGEEIEFKSLWEAAKYIKNKYKKENANIDHICNNIKRGMKGACNTAYGYKWEAIAYYGI